MRKLLPVLFCLLVLISCDDDNGTSLIVTTLVEVQIDPTTDTSLTDNWIVVHNKEGDVIEFKSYERGESFFLQTQKPLTDQTITVTLVSHYVFFDKDQYYAQSYCRVPIGQLFKTGSNSPNASSSHTGSFKVAITGVNSFFNHSMSDQFGHESGYSYSFSLGNLTFDAETYEATKKFFLTVDNQSAIRYKFIDNVKPNDSYNYTFGDLNTFDHEVDFTFPDCKDVSVFAYQHEPGQSTRELGYNVRSFYAGGTSYSNVKVGYINTLTNPRTAVGLTYEGYALAYDNYGTVPNANFTWPSKSDFDIISKDIRAFDCLSDKPFVYRRSTWEYYGSDSWFTWVVVSADEKHAVGDLPAEIIAMHPSMSIGNLTYYGSTFYTRSHSYSQIIQDFFVSAQRASYEDISISINDR